MPASTREVDQFGDVQRGAVSAPSSVLPVWLLSSSVLRRGCGYEAALESFDQLVSGSSTLSGSADAALESRLRSLDDAAAAPATGEERPAAVEVPPLSAAAVAVVTQSMRSHSASLPVQLWGCSSLSHLKPLRDRAERRLACTEARAEEKHAREHVARSD